MDIGRVLNPKESRFYFSDFHCTHGHSHHVSIVVTNPRSQTENVAGFRNADEWCRAKLAPLNVIDVDTDLLQNFFADIDVLTRYVCATTQPDAPSLERVQLATRALSVHVANLRGAIMRNLFTPSEEFTKKLLKKVQLRSCPEIGKQACSCTCTMLYPNVRECVYTYTVCP